MLDQEKDLKAAEDARKQRHLKKFGKQVQHEKAKQRLEDKKKVLEKVSSLRKKSRQNGGGIGETGDVDFDVETVQSEIRDSRLVRKSHHLPQIHLILFPTLLIRAKSHPTNLATKRMKNMDSVELKDTLNPILVTLPMIYHPLTPRK